MPALTIRTPREDRALEGVMFNTDAGYMCPCGALMDSLESADMGHKGPCPMGIELGRIRNEILFEQLTLAAHALQAVSQ